MLTHCISTLLRDRKVRSPEKLELCKGKHFVIVVFMKRSIKTKIDNS